MNITYLNFSPGGLETLVESRWATLKNQDIRWGRINEMFQILFGTMLLTALVFQCLRPSGKE